MPKFNLDELLRPMPKGRKAASPNEDEEPEDVSEGDDRGESPDEEGDSDVTEDQESCFHDLLQAIDSGDAKAGVEALLAIVGK